MSCHVTSRHNTSRHVTWHHITPHHIIYITFVGSKRPKVFTEDNRNCLQQGKQIGRFEWVSVLCLQSKYLIRLHSSLLSKSADKIDIRISIFGWNDIRHFPYLAAIFSLQWRSNERDGVSHHRCLVFFYSIVCSGSYQEKYQSAGNSPVTVEYPAQRASNSKNIPFDDVIMSRLLTIRSTAMAHL